LKYLNKNFEHSFTIKKLIKMKSTLIKIVAAVSMVASVVACKESFFDTPPQGTLSNSLLSNSKSGVDATVISAYKGLIGWTGNWAEDPWGTAPSNWIFNIASDEFHKGSEAGDGDAWQDFELYVWSPNSGILRSKFKATYEGINRANSAINNASEFLKNNPGEAEYANRAIAEATFLRAYYHFEAYKVWKNKAPYFTEKDKDFRKAPEADLMAKVISDLQASIKGLPITKSQAGRVDQMVAKSFLGKAYLYAGNYAEAKKSFDEVIASGRYKLSDSFYDNFSVAGDNNAESIFAAQTSVNDGDPDGFNSNFGERLALPHGSSPYGCCGFKTPSYEQAQAYMTDDKGLPVAITASTTLKRMTPNKADVVDPRLDYTVGRTGVPYLDWGPHADGWVRGQGYAGWYSPKKNAHAKSDDYLKGSWTGTQLSALNVELMRYADLLLMAAECEVEVGSLDKAIEYVNLIRKRAGATAQGVTSPKVALNAAEITWATYKVGEYPKNTNKDAVRDIVRLERRLELGLEGHRIFDLQRWKTLVPVISAYQQREKKLINFMSGARVPEARHLNFPMPQAEIELSGGKLTQHEGY
jgi:starch-binding outer membrane protein, SusD/RagB family